LKKITRTSEAVFSPKGRRQRRLHKAFLRYHDPENWPLLRDALQKMGRADLIGNGKRHLVPRWQPAGTGSRPEGARRSSGQQRFRTQHTQAEATDRDAKRGPGKRRRPGARRR
jgi:hypothetical protein